MAEEYTEFRIKNLFFPRILSQFLGQAGVDFTSAYRVEGQVIDSKTLRLLFGINLQSNKKLENGTSVGEVTVEVIGEFEFTHDLPDAAKIPKLHVVPNLLAILYPFLREKVNYCFAANTITMFLPPLNTIDLLAKDEIKNSFIVLDDRAKDVPAQKDL